MVEERPVKEEEEEEEEPDKLMIYGKAAGIVIGLNIINFILFAYAINICNPSSFQVILTFLVVIANLIVMDWIRRRLVDNLLVFLILLAFWAALLAVVYIMSSPLSCNAASFAMTCASTSQYSCGIPALNTTGTNATLSIVVAQETQQAEYNVGIACTSSSSTQTAAFEYPGSTGGRVSAQLPSNPLTLAPGNNANITGIVCYQSQYQPMPNSPGAYFIGSLYINYTTSPAAPSASNPWVTTRIGTLSLRVP
jgi:hypothetical protein